MAAVHSGRIPGAGSHARLCLKFGLHQQVANVICCHDPRMRKDITAGYSTIQQAQGFILPGEYFSGNQVPKLKVSRVSPLAPGGRCISPRRSVCAGLQFHGRPRLHSMPKQGVEINRFTITSVRITDRIISVGLVIVRIVSFQHDENQVAETPVIYRYPLIIARVFFTGKCIKVNCQRLYPGWQHRCND